MREKLEASQAERELLAARLAQAMREKELSRKEIEDRSKKEEVSGLSLHLSIFDSCGVLLPCVRAAGHHSLQCRIVTSFRSKERGDSKLDAAFMSPSTLRASVTPSELQ